MASVPRDDKLFDRIAANGGLSRNGAQWVRQSLDPFHDTMLVNPVGYPDTTSSASIVQVIKQEYTVAAPIASGNWDCNICMMPWLNGIPFASTTNGAGANPTQNSLVQANPVLAASPVIGGVQVIAAASGTPLVLGTVTTAGTYLNQSNTIPAQYLQGNGRVVGIAMEIANTTSVLSLQGMETVWQVPFPQNDDASTMSITNNVTTDTVSNKGSAEYVYVPCPPTTVANAQLFPGTRAWEAKKGSYHVGLFNTPDIPATGINFTQPAIYTTAQSDAAILSPIMIKNGAFPPALTEGNAVVSNVAWSMINMKGAFFTGLSNSSTLTINYVVYIERFPTQDDLDLIVSAHASPDYDIKALEMYSEIAQSLPVAVTFDQNGWGDWWDTIKEAASSVVDTARTYVAPVLSYFGGARGQALAAGIEGIGAVKDAFDAPPSDYIPNAPRNPPMVTPGRQRRPKSVKFPTTAMQMVRKKKVRANGGQLHKRTQVRGTYDNGLRSELTQIKRRLKVNPGARSLRKR